MPTGRLSRHLPLQLELQLEVHLEGAIMLQGRL
jgi:hypothetical protein